MMNIHLIHIDNKQVNSVSVDASELGFDSLFENLVDSPYPSMEHDSYENMS